MSLSKSFKEFYTSLSWLPITLASSLYSFLLLLCSHPIIYTVHAARNFNVTPHQTFPGLTVPKFPVLKDPVVPIVPKFPVVPTFPMPKILSRPTIFPKLPFGSFHFPTIAKIPEILKPKFSGWPKLP